MSNSSLIVISQNSIEDPSSDTSFVQDDQINESIQNETQSQAAYGQEFISESTQLPSCKNDVDYLQIIETGCQGFPQSKIDAENLDFIESMKTQPLLKSLKEEDHNQQSSLQIKNKTMNIKQNSEDSQKYLDENYESPSKRTPPHILDEQEEKQFQIDSTETNQNQQSLLNKGLNMELIQQKNEKYENELGNAQIQINDSQNEKLSQVSENKQDLPLILESQLIHKKDQDKQNNICLTKSDEQINENSLNVEEVLSNIFEKLPETSQYFQKRPDLKTQLSQNITTQFQNKILNFDIFKKWIKPKEIEIFKSELNSHLENYLNNFSGENKAEIDEEQLKISQFPLNEFSIFIESEKFFKEQLLEDQFVSEYCDSLKKPSLQIGNSIPKILMRDKIIFLQKLESKFQKEFSDIENTFQQMKDPKENHPFYLLLLQSELNKSLFSILQPKSGSLMNEEDGIRELTKRLNSFQNVILIDKSIKDSNFEEQLKIAFLQLEINNEILNEDDFIFFIKDIFLDNGFCKWVTEIKSTNEKIQLKLKEEKNELSYSETLKKEQTFLQVIERLFGTDHISRPENFLKCMYSLSIESLRQNLQQFDSQNKNISEPLKQKGIINLLMPYIQTHLKQAKNFEELFLLFCEDEKMPEYQLNLQNFMKFLLRKFESEMTMSLDIIECYSKFSQPFSLLYKWIDQKTNKSLKATLNLSQFRRQFSNSIPFLISLGDGESGTSTILNHIYQTNFQTIKHSLFENDIDISFSTSQLTIGMHIIDIHGDCTEKIDRLTLLLKILKRYQFWVLVQSKSLEKLNEINQILKSKDIDPIKIILLLKDRSYSKEEIEQNQPAFGKSTFFQISRTHENRLQGVYGRDLGLFKQLLFQNIGFGNSIKIVQKDPIEFINNYWDTLVEVEKDKQLFQNIQILLDFKLEKISKLMTEIVKGIHSKQYLMEQQLIQLRDLMNLPKFDKDPPFSDSYKAKFSNCKNIKNQIFAHITINQEISELKVLKKKTSLKGSDSNNLREINRLLDKICDLQKLLEIQKVHPIVKFYIDALSQGKSEELDEFEMIIELISKPVLKPLEAKVQLLYSQLQGIKINLNACEKKYYDKVQNESHISSDQVQSWVKSQAQQDDTWKNFYKQSESISNELLMNQKLLENSMMSKDLFNREMIYLIQKQNQQPQFEMFIRENLIKVLADQFLSGKPLEIIDGNNSTINYGILKDIFQEVIQRKQKDNIPFEFLPVAILGPQSTGKSTLINMIFGCDFKVSSGRCTKGMDISLKKVYFNNKLYNVLVIDTEGLLSIEKSDETYDKQLTLLSMACASKVIVNVNGEINNAIKKILTVSLFAGNKLKEIKRPELLFCLRNMVDTNPDKLKESLIAIERELGEVAKINKMQLSSCLEFKGEHSLVLMRSAFNIETNYLHQDDNTVLFEKITTEKQFMQTIEGLKLKIFDGQENFKQRSLIDWLNGCASCWEAIQSNFDIFMIDSMKEIEDRNCLGQIMYKLKQTSIYQDVSEKYKNIRQQAQTSLNFANSANQANLNATCKKDLSDIFNQSTEEITNEFKNQTDGFQNKDLLMEYTKSLSQDLNLIFLKQNQLWEETYFLNENGLIIEKKLINLKKKLQEFLMKLTSTDNETEIQSRQQELNQIFKKSISLYEIELTKELKKKEPSYLDFCKQNEQYFSSYLKSIKLEDYPYQNNHIQKLQEQIIQRSYLELSELSDWCRDQIDDILEKFFPLICDERVFNGIEIFIPKTQIILQNSQMQKQTKGNFCGGQNYFQKKMVEFSSLINLEKIKGYFYNQSFQKLQNIELEREQMDPQIQKFSRYVRLVNLNKYNIEKFYIYLIDQLHSQIVTPENSIRKMHNFVESVSEQLKQECMDLTPEFKENIIASLLYFEFCIKQIDRVKQNQEENIKNLNDQATQLKNKFEDMIREGINEQKNIQEIIQCLNANITSHITSKFKSDTETDLRQQSLLITPQQLNQECYQNFGSDSSTKESIQQFLDNFYEYRRQKNNDMIKELKDSIVETHEKQFQNQISNLHLIFATKFTFIHSIFFQLDLITLEQSNKTELSKKCAELFIAVFIGDKQKYQVCLDFILSSQSEQIREIIQSEMLAQQNTTKFIFSSDNINQQPTILQICDPNTLILNLLQSFLHKNEENIKMNNLDLQKQIDEVNSAKLLMDLRQKSQYLEIINFNERKYEEYSIVRKCCNQICPFCSQPCDLEKGHSGKHTLKYHSFMSFKGVFEYDRDQKQLVFDYCNSDSNLAKFFRKTQINTNELTERISQYSLTTRNLFFTLTWNNKHDLDLYVKCPCGTIIYYLNNKCQKCQTYLELDKNVNPNELVDDPAEHIYLQTIPEPNQKFEFWVYWAQSDREGPNTCEFEIQVLQEGSTSLLKYRDVLDRKLKKLKSEVKSFFTQQYGTPFQEYMAQHHKDWTIIKSDQPQQLEWVHRQQNAWRIIGEELSKQYNLQNNPPF